MNPVQLDSFMAIYQQQLLDVVSRPDSGYSYGPELVPTVVAKMRAAIAARTYNKEGLAFKKTCKVLKIKHTYTDILAYLSHT